MASVAAAGTAAAVIVCMDKKTSGDGSIGIHHLNKVGKGEARGEGDGEMHDAVVGILEEAVVAADSAGDAAELLEVAADVVGSETVRDR
jgi:hypothetical protein